MTHLPEVEEIFPRKRPTEVLYLSSCRFPRWMNRKITSPITGGDVRGLTLEQFDLVNCLIGMDGVLSIEFTAAKIVVRCEYFVDADLDRVQRLITSLVLESQPCSRSAA